MFGVKFCWTDVPNKCKCQTQMRVKSSLYEALTSAKMKGVSNLRSTCPLRTAATGLGPQRYEPSLSSWGVASTTCHPPLPSGRPGRDIQDSFHTWKFLQRNRASVLVSHQFTKIHLNRHWLKLLNRHWNEALYLQKIMTINRKLNPSKAFFSILICVTVTFFTVLTLKFY